MSPANRPGGRTRRTVSGGGNVFRRGSGLGSGSVGNGPRGSSGGSFDGGSGGDRGVGGGGLLAVLLAQLIGGSSNNGNGTSKRGCLGRILILALIIVGAALPIIWVMIKKNKRLALLGVQLSDAFTIICNALRVGQSFQSAMKNVADNPCFFRIGTAFVQLSA